MGVVIENLRRWFKQKPPIELTPSQREALIDAIVFAVMADGVEEISEYRELIEGGKSWKGGIKIGPYFHASKERAVEAMLDDASRSSYCADISGRLESGEARELAFEIAASTICSDGDIDPAELALMSTLAHAFGVAEERATELTDKARSKHGID